MTGVIGGRPELTIMGSVDFDSENGLEGEWKELTFPHKLSDTKFISGIVMPHQPRFDWQLWFSALSTFEQEYYLIHFLYKLMNNDKAAKSILNHDPFEGKAPKQIRIFRDHY